MSKQITYQPYIFAISLLALFTKVAYSVTQGQQVTDAFLWIFLAVFVISSLLWYLDSRNRLKKPHTIDVNIKTGKVKDSEILGAETRQTDRAKIGIETGDTENAKLTGYKETN